MADTFSPKQWDIILDPLKTFNIISGVTGSGKSYAVNYRWYREILEAPKNAVLMQTGNTSESLYDNITAPLLEIDNDEDGVLVYKSIENRPRIICKTNGANVVCIGANNEKAQDRVQGKNVWRWYGDEIVKQPKSFVQMCNSRCRATVDGQMIVTPRIWTCNPDSPTHYIKTDYIDKPETWNVYFGFNDNPYINDEYIEEMKKQFSGVFYERMIEGKWTLSEGSIYNEFRNDIHIISERPRMVDYFLGVDWGYNNPMALVLMGQDYDGNYIILDEIYLSKQLVDGTLKDEMTRRGWFNLKVNENQAKGTGPSYIFADSESPADCQQFHQLTGWSVIPVKKGAGSVLDGIKLVQQFLKLQDNGKPRLYVMEGCTNVIKEFNSYQWKKRVNKDEIDDPEKKNDHSMDAIRYVIYSREYGKVRVIGRNPMRG